MKQLGNSSHCAWSSARSGQFSCCAGMEQKQGVTVTRLSAELLLLLCLALSCSAYQLCQLQQAQHEGITQYGCKLCCCHNERHVCTVQKVMEHSPDCDPLSGCQTAPSKLQLCRPELHVRGGVHDLTSRSKHPEAHPTNIHSITSLDLVEAYHTTKGVAPKMPPGQWCAGWIHHQTPGSKQWCLCQTISSAC